MVLAIQVYVYVKSHVWRKILEDALARVMSPMILVTIPRSPTFNTTMEPQNAYHATQRVPLDAWDLTTGNALNHQMSTQVVTLLI